MKPFFVWDFFKQKDILFHKKILFYDGRWNKYFIQSIFVVCENKNALYKQFIII